MNGQGLEKVQRQVRDAIEKGARIVTGGTSPGGLYFDPTVITGLDSRMLVMREETFGPVAPVLRFRDEAEAIRLANDTPYGLAS